MFCQKKPRSSIEFIFNSEWRNERLEETVLIVLQSIYLPGAYKSISSSVLVPSISPNHYYKVIFFNVEFTHKHWEKSNVWSLWQRLLAVYHFFFSSLVIGFLPKYMAPSEDYISWAAKHDHCDQILANGSGNDRCNLRLALKTRGRVSPVPAFRLECRHDGSWSSPTKPQKLHATDE